MESIQEHLKADHRRCDGFFVEAEQLAADGNWEAADEGFKTFHQAMEHHYTMEEEVLFPDFEEASGSTAGPSQVMRMEHQQMRELLADMTQAMSEKDSDAFLGTAETLLILMQQHNAKEEQILYPMCDDLLGSKRDEVLSRMEAVKEA
ncbi:MAG TPA: hemerythrin domain-containing protein [Gammaproteobacteria bacterium]|nr:hemerythrin domain-containing protein [Gammaproteobacteria bacterium]